ncbi:DUF4124 domain-containing protein [Kangiella koreensis]|uniref:DUF4124 domain-containing protein n=1 Tax=Kangiella koreensis (strain DSM 16069 / JCM 12317 / KCTC 12182 / SW-125) TaxID=523791 RepID=C7R8D3_KANKD|nr:DUF4124 domain-containing protein [Kangiella koreensis]ACV27698.1 conserved hypothetical protein [Kangiella koreensis DSM 16069]
MSLKVSYLFNVFILIVSCSWLTSADATVLYKKVDKDGKVTYTDKPGDDAEAITVHTDRNVVSTPRMNSGSPQQSTDSEEENEGAAYEVFAIDSPADDQGVRANDGSLTIVVGISPQIQPNHSIRMHMDGMQVGQDQKIPYFNLANIDRGTHELVAMVINDETQEIVQTSKSVTFHLLRTSILNR